jgi:cytochrome c peroxidase
MDKRLSRDNTISCFSCHNIHEAGADSKRQFSVGVNKRQGEINTPTVFNSSLNFVQFWDGRAKDLKEQIEGPIHNPVEMDHDWPSIIQKLKQDGFYKNTFKLIYSEQITPDNVKDAIAFFESTLITPNSRFDQFLKGNPTVISQREKTGYKKFKDYGCISCHQGVNIGGNMFQTMGIAQDYFKDRGNTKKIDFGRYNVTGDEEDKHVFKVPSLRNVTLTPPYFHDGSAKNLPEAIRIMGKYQLGRDLSKEDIELIADFLKTLEARPISNSEKPKEKR